MTTTIAPAATAAEVRARVRRSSPVRGRAVRALGTGLVAHERGGSYDPRPGADGADDDAPGSEAAWADLDAALDTLARVDLEALDVDHMQDAIRQAQRRVARVEALRDRWIGVLRRAERARAPRGKPAAGDEATDSFLTDELLLAPSQAKRSKRVDEQLGWAPATRAALEAGDLSNDHAAVIGQALSEVVFDQRPELERQLLELAGHLHPVALRREATRLVAELDQASAEEAARRRHLRRRASWTRDADGALQLHATLHGQQAEIAEVALRAATARRTDDDVRTDDHRRADALVALFDLALRARELPATHGVRPHVSVTVDHATLERGYGTATLGSGTTVTLSELGSILTDCTLTRIVLDADGAPCDASVGVRTVPRGLVKLLHARDRHCVWPRCDRPAVWCQIAHTGTPHGADGRLTIDNTALLCEAHHERYDAGGWRIDIHGHRVTLHRDPDRPPAWSIVAAHRRRSGSAPSRADTATRAVDPADRRARRPRAAAPVGAAAQTAGRHGGSEPGGEVRDGPAARPAPMVGEPATAHADRLFGPDPP